MKSKSYSVIFLFLFFTACSQPVVELTSTPEAATPLPLITPTDAVCEKYFESINPVILVKEGEKNGVRSIILQKSVNCSISNFEDLDLKIKVENNYLDPEKSFSDQIFDNLQGDSSFIRLDFDKYEIPSTETLDIVVEDNNGNELIDKEILNISITGIFQIPEFVNLESDKKTTDLLDSYELRVYHVDSMPQEDGLISSSFNINDIQDYKDQCDSPDGIHPEFIHWNAIDYGRCEWGPGSIIYEVFYMGPYPMIVRDIDITENVGIGVTFDFDFDQISNPPLFAIENEDDNLEFYYFVLKYYHLVEINVNVGEKINPGTMIGTIGQFKNSTELHEERGLIKTKNGEIIYPEKIQPIPFKLTLSVEDGQWIEGLINIFNNQ